MTQAEKARAYEEALERARLSRMQLLDIGEEATEIEYIFPELKESEDEKIRKTLKHYLEVRRCQTQSDEEYINCNNFLAWLEKQSEQKSSWTKEDDVRLQACIDALQAESLMGKVDTVITKWLESLKQRIGG